MYLYNTEIPEFDIVDYYMQDYQLLLLQVIKEGKSDVLKCLPLCTLVLEISCRRTSISGRGGEIHVLPTLFVTINYYRQNAYLSRENRLKSTWSSGDVKRSRVCPISVWYDTCQWTKQRPMMSRLHNWSTRCSLPRETDLEYLYSKADFGNACVELGRFVLPNRMSRWWQSTLFPPVQKETLISVIIIKYM